MSHVLQLTNTLDGRTRTGGRRMSRHVTRITVSLLKLAKRLENQMHQLKQCGITVLPLENAQIDAINILLQVNGIHKNDEGVSWLCEPLIQYIDGDIQMGECLLVLRERLQDLRQNSGMRHVQ